MAASPAGKHGSRGFRANDHPRTCDPSKVERRGGADSDSDSDSLADLVETPTPTRSAKKQRTMPVRRSRAVRRTYYGDDDGDDDDDNDNKNKSNNNNNDSVGGGYSRRGAKLEEESDDEFDPFKKRAEQQKIEARKNRTRRYLTD